MTDLLAYAYDIQTRQMVGLPAWAESDKYEIEGVAPSDQEGEPNWKFMMRKLLADRFGLQFHTGTTEMPVYELHVGKNGPKLGEVQTSPGQGSLYLSPASSGSGVTLHAKGQTMAGLAKILEGTELDRPVVDRTGITGKFDFEMTFLSDRIGRGGGGPSPPVEDEPNAPPGIFTAIQDQLGLKLEPAKGPTETLVIDHIQKPELDVEAAPAGAGAEKGAFGPVRSLNVTQTRDIRAATLAADAPVFAVSSVKPSGPDSAARKVHIEPGHFLAQGVTLRILIKIAYDLNDDQLSGGPTWTAFKRFDVEGKVDPAVLERTNTMTTKEVETFNRQLLQGLLSERFKLRMRTDMKDMPIYALVLGKSGAKLKPAHGAAGDPKTTWKPGLVTGQGASMDDLTRELEEAVRHPVQNLTGLNGAYDFRLEWTPDQNMAPANPLDPASQQYDMIDSGPTLFSALQQQLGLRLDRRTTRAPYEAIESVELPTDN